MSVTDEPLLGRPSIKDNLAMVKKVESVTLDDRRLTMERVMAKTGLSCGTAWRIIHEELHINKKAKVQKSAGKLMLSFFWDSRRVMLTDYLSKSETLNSYYYCNLLEKLCDALKQKHHGMISKGVCLLADNAPVHTAQASFVTTHRLGYELLQHPPYSPHLAPSDFFLFPEMKKTTSLVGNLMTEKMSFLKWNSGFRAKC
ncbi:hypothetical protein JRQ81_011528 [Phrynocephalus forsythii]|uniref:Transposase n=1 Tax=Phrynocephalus forsythii TaxID=171643 RepID=A0A9Q0Y1I3_9SAUR|nr:hypothetical protein JRQ81_011528 [Phrynocephalus forsythii]